VSRVARNFCLVLLASSALVGAAGCSDKLETGYKPRKLGASESQRRAYYASPFSPESMPEDAIDRPTHRRPNE
jgi:hypothetical protein